MFAWLQHQSKLFYRWHCRAASTAIQRLCLTSTPRSSFFSLVLFFELRCLYRWCRLCLWQYSYFRAGHLIIFGDDSSISQILARVPDAEDCKGQKHEDCFEDPKYPLVCHTIAVVTLCKFYHTEYTTNLSSWNVSSAKRLSGVWFHTYQNQNTWNINSGENLKPSFRCPW